MPGYPTAPTTATITDKLASIAPELGNIAGLYVYLKEPFSATVYESATPTDSGGNWSIANVPLGVTYQYAYGIHPSTAYPFRGTYVAANPPSGENSGAALGGVLYDQGGAVFNVRSAKYGALGFGKMRSDASMTSGTNVMTSSSGSRFANAQVGWKVWLFGAGAAGAVLATSILSVDSGSQIHTVDNASTTVGPTARYIFGPDDTTAINAARTAILAVGRGVMVIPPSTADPGAGAAGNLYLYNGTLQGAQGLVVYAYGASVLETGDSVNLINLAPASGSKNQASFLGGRWIAKQEATNPTPAIMAGAGNQLTNVRDVELVGSDLTAGDGTKYGTVGFQLVGRAATGIYYGTYDSIAVHGCTGDGFVLDGWDGSLNDLNDNTFLNATSRQNGGSGYNFIAGSGNWFFGAESEGNGTGFTYGAHAQEIHVLGGWNESNATPWSLDTSIANYQQTSIWIGDATADPANPTYFALYFNGALSTYHEITIGANLRLGKQLRRSAQTVTPSAGVIAAIDPTLGEICEVPILAANVTSILTPGPSGSVKDGMEITIRAQQAASGGPFTVSGWSANFKGIGTTQLSATASAFAMWTFVFCADTGFWHLKAFATG